ncbi:MAG: ATP-grasp domain-containing protein [Acidimicrobiia bacterium]|nr:ATP-grasp domain-containing protein [Acidimicrobiia bacterium]
MRAPRVAVVDPYSGGSNLAPALMRRGHEAVMVQSTTAIPQLFRRSCVPADFAHHCVHDGDVDATAGCLAALDVCAVIAGCDMGVELADALSERLGLRSNGTALSAARRDKAIMGEVVAAAGLRTIPQCSSDAVEVLETWATTGARWPVIAKPHRSCGSDAVALCGSGEELRVAFDRIVGAPSVLGESNLSVLIQEFVDGPEYVVDAVSLDGLHRPAAFWRYTRPAPRAGGPHGFVCYDAMVLLPYEGLVQRELFSYACAALDALGIRHGPSHCEIIVDGDGPVLVEIGARLSGGNNAVLSASRGGLSALDLTLDAALEPHRFRAEAHTAPRLSGTVANFFLRPWSPGVLRALPRLAEVEALASFQSLRIGAHIGLPMPAVAGLVTLAHDDREVVESDLAALREIASEGFYLTDDGGQARAS